MHRSRFYGLFVYAPLQQAGDAVSFWAAALGVAPRQSEPEDGYTALLGATGSIGFEVQAVDDSHRYHIDIETDDVAAEVARLVGLGASVHERRAGWVVLRAPGGHLLCVVPVQSERAFFAANARTWESPDPPRTT
jgi:hypothetical protein